mgnify:CR=1 FL=1
MTRVVEVKDLVAGYLPGVNILNGTNLYADKGELIGIIGPNGAGKSTLLKSIFGLVKVREGSITLNGENITGLKPNQLVSKGVGFIPQTNNVFPSLTIEENLQMGIFQEPAKYNERLEFVVSIFAELGKRLAPEDTILSEAVTNNPVFARQVPRPVPCTMIRHSGSGLGARTIGRQPLGPRLARSLAANEGCGDPQRGRRSPRPAG